MLENQSKPLTKVEKKMQTMRRFINTTRQILDEEGIEGVSIRKIALASGYHNSTLYVHFKDLDELIMLASMKYFHRYSEALSVQSAKEVSPLENFFTVWELFFDTLLEKPNILYNFFFGPKSTNLNDVSNKYYDVFPEELQELSPVIHSMYFGQNVLDRNTHIQMSLLGHGTPVNEKNMHFLSELSVSYCKYQLEKKVANPNYDSDILRSEFMYMLQYLFNPSNDN